MRMRSKKVLVVERQTTLGQVGCQANISLPYSVKLLVVVAILLNVTSLSHAEEAKLGVTFDVTYLSSNIWRGFDLYPDDHSAIQPSIDVDFYDTGFGLKVLSSRANGSGFEDSEELDYTLRYRNSFLNSQRCQTNYEFGWVYYSYPDRPRKGVDVNPFATIPIVETLSDMQEFYMAYAWPEILGIKGLVPYYVNAYVWPAQSGSHGKHNGGCIHAFGLDFWIPVHIVLPDYPDEQQFLKFKSEVVYNSGVGATGLVEHDWSHAVFSFSTDFALSENLTFSPGIYYQLSMEETVNTEDEYWFSLSMSYDF